MKNAPVEAKVKSATAAAALIGALVTMLNAVVADSRLLGALPPWLQAAATLVAPPLAVYWAGWQARHTERLPSGPSSSGV